MCVVLTLYRCRVACCFCVKEVMGLSRKVGLWGLECAPWFRKAHLQRPGISAAVRACVYVCHSSMIIVQILSLWHRHRYIATRGFEWNKAHTNTHLNIHSPRSVLAPWHVFQLSSIFPRSLIKQIKGSQANLSSHTVPVMCLCARFYAHVSHCLFCVLVCLILGHIERHLAIIVCFVLSVNGHLLQIVF